VEFAGIIIAMYAADHNPPHVHVMQAEHEALVDIKTGVVLAGSVPVNKLRQALDWIHQNRQALLEKWEELNS
jgi:hypothetical protein